MSVYLYIFVLAALLCHAALAAYALLNGVIMPGMISVGIVAVLACLLAVSYRKYKIRW